MDHFPTDLARRPASGVVGALCARDRRRLFERETDTERSDLTHADEALRRLRREEHVADDLLLADGSRLGGVGYLPLDERRST